MWLFPVWRGIANYAVVKHGSVPSVPRHTTKGRWGVGSDPSDEKALLTL